MYFYRGDDRSPTDKTIQAVGFNAKPPAPTLTAGEARQLLTKELSTKKLKDLGFGWRVTTPGGLISTAMTEAGCYDKKVVYRIEIPDSELTAQEIHEKGVIGNIITLDKVGELKSYFILRDGSTYMDATIIAFCHGVVTTKEATFLTAIPSKYITGFRYTSDTLSKNPKTGIQRAYDVTKVPFAPMLRVGVHYQPSALVETKESSSLPKKSPGRLDIANCFKI